MLTLTSPVETPLHRIPAGPKLCTAIGASIAFYQIGALPSLGVATLTIGTGYLLLGGMPFLRQGLAALRPVAPFVALLAIWHLVIGDPHAGAVSILRLVAMLAIANLVTMTTPLTEMIAVTERLARPLRVLGAKPRSLALAIALAIRFIPFFRARLQAIATAWRARSRRRPRPRILVAVLLALFDDAERVADALRARGGALD